LKTPKLPPTAAAILAAAATIGLLAAQQGPETIDLEAFPAQSIDEVVVPVPSEVFVVLDKLGNPNWRREMRESLGKQTTNRAQVALLLGTVIVARPIDAPPWPMNPMGRDSSQPSAM
jgi:hypothetical protein